MYPHRVTQMPSPCSSQSQPSLTRIIQQANLVHIIGDALTCLSIESLKFSVGLI